MLHDKISILVLYALNNDPCVLKYIFSVANIATVLRCERLYNCEQFFGKIFWHQVFWFQRILLFKLIFIVSILQPMMIITISL